MNKSVIVFCCILFFSLNQVHAQLQGVFTIGKSSPFSPSDFLTIEDATEILKNGVTGPVTFNIKPGTYQGLFTIGYIPGANAVNRVIFQAENGDSSSVILYGNGGSNVGILNIIGSAFCDYSECHNRES